ncbi:hypothetical protein OIE66_06850 [Nonomuraea sp. NBC_01738]|uniref:hypothetical protein n=1 Tax=Nonomuraea sp. NBC_01738 TaxID=2976003 RepID=UPI002E146D55|nr:hypothetical protein OIE66_06850 [Nonomuraea sp. NBC_01738]
MHGELITLGLKVAASTVWEILKQEDNDPAPERASATWTSADTIGSGEILHEYSHTA